MSFCLRKVLALVISSSLDSSEYWDSRTLSMHLGGRGRCVCVRSWGGGEEREDRMKRGGGRGWGREGKEEGVKEESRKRRGRWKGKMEGEVKRER